jgi:hypothetical protein
MLRVVPIVTLIEDFATHVGGDMRPRFAANAGKLNTGIADQR